MKILALLPLFLAAGLPAIPPPPTPGDQVLLIYVNTPSQVFLANNVKNALNALPVAQRPTTTDLVIPLGDKDGIADQIGGSPDSYLAGFCQVWDLRFMELNNNISYSGTIQEDSITTAGANNDGLLYRNFLGQGGHLFIMGENEGFYARNEGLIQFISDATGAPISYPNTPTTWAVTGIDNSAPEFFRTAYDTLIPPLTLSTYPGRIPLAGIGNGTPLSTEGGYTLDLLWQAGQLTSGNGKMMIAFDSNLFSIPEPQGDKYVRNTYTTLSACYNFTITKAVSQSTVCAGDPVSFTLCYHNLGPRTINNAVVSDTLPNCTVFQNSTPASSGSAGQLRWWNLGNLAPGPQQCITINVLTTFCP